MKDNRGVCVIPARGGSKSVPRKNLRPVDGSPLIARAIRTAQQATLVRRVVVSTDDAEIAEVARQHGADVPFLRPSNLADDTSPMLPALHHALTSLQAQGPIDYVVAVQATCPFLRPETIDSCIQTFLGGELDGVLTVRETPYHPLWCKRMGDDGLVTPFLDGEHIPTLRQELPPVFAVTGAVYVASRDLLTRRLRSGGAYVSQDSEDRIGAVVLGAQEALDIDTETDLAFAEVCAGRRGRAEPRPGLL